MKVEYFYGAHCAITIHFVLFHEFASAEYRERFSCVQDAVAAAEQILADHPYGATGCTIWDAETGEVLAQCTQDWFDKDN